jgi:hypothetical protein
LVRLGLKDLWVLQDQLALTVQWLDHKVPRVRLGQLGLPALIALWLGLWVPPGLKDLKDQQVARVLIVQSLDQLGHKDHKVPQVLLVPTRLLLDQLELQELLDHRVPKALLGRMAQTAQLQALQDQRVLKVHRELQALLAQMALTAL